MTADDLPENIGTQDIKPVKIEKLSRRERKALTIAQSRERYLRSKRENPKRVTRKLQLAIELMIRKGLTQREAAQRAGLREETLSRALRKSHVIRYREERIREYIKELSGLAAGKLEELLRGARSEKVRLEAIKDVLDRAGIVAGTQGPQALVQVNIQLDPESGEGPEGK